MNFFFFKKKGEEQTFFMLLIYTFSYSILIHSKVNLQDFFLNLINLLFGCAGSLLLHAGFFLVVASGGHSIFAVCRLLVAVVSLVAQHGL